MSKPVTLKRSLSLPMITLYGLGTTIGAGIYALTGEIAGIAGYNAPLAFLLASILAGFTALSFAELSSRFPFAAGAALYVKHGLGSITLSSCVGLLVIAAGLVSSAALVNGLVGHIEQFIDAERLITILVITLILGGIAAWGISESVTVASIITLIEVGGLIVVIAVSGDAILSVSQRWTELLPSDISNWQAIFFAAILSFYAFIGFEDMVDVAEEVKDVSRQLPIAIMLTLTLTLVLYVLLMIAAVFSVPPDELAASDVPLAYLYEQNTGQNAFFLVIIGMFAVINGALIQMVMASRVLYGLSSRGQLPAFLSRVNQKTRTPLFATLIVTALVMLLAMYGSLLTLAETTSLIMLTIFSLVNLSLWRIKMKDATPKSEVSFPIWVPIIGFFVSAGFVTMEFVHFFR